MTPICFNRSRVFEPILSVFDQNQIIIKTRKIVFKINIFKLLVK